MFSFRLSAFFLFLAIAKVKAEVVQESGTIWRKGSFTFSYDKDVSNSCESVVMIGVGTAGNPSMYDTLSKLISTDNSIVTVFFDQNPGNIVNPVGAVKYNPKDYANFFKTFTGDLAKYLPVCDGKSPKIIIGGHSASGRGGLQAMMHEGVKADGFIGLDPWQVSETGIPGLGPRNVPATSVDPSLPVLSWGFERQTCFATLDVAGKALYELSGKNNRVFFRADNSDRRGRVGHCSFTDNGCFPLPVPNCPNPPNNNVKEVVAESIQIFVRSVENGSIKAADFMGLANDDFEVFVDPDPVEASGEASGEAVEATAEE